MAWRWAEWIPASARMTVEPSVRRDDAREPPRSAQVT